MAFDEVNIDLTLIYLDIQKTIERILNYKTAFNYV